MHDRRTHTTELVDLCDLAPAQALPWSFDPAISADGRFVALKSNGCSPWPAGWDGVFVIDRLTGLVELVNAPGDASSWDPAVSGDGRYVVYSGGSTGEIFVRDRATKVIQRVSVGHTTYSQWPDISTDGRYIVYAE